MDKPEKIVQCCVVISEKAKNELRLISGQYQILERESAILE